MEINWRSTDVFLTCWGCIRSCLSWVETQYSTKCISSYFSCFFPRLVHDFLRISSLICAVFFGTGLLQVCGSLLLFQIEIVKYMLAYTKSNWRHKISMVAMMNISVKVGEGRGSAPGDRARILLCKRWYWCCLWDWSEIVRFIRGSQWQFWSNRLVFVSC